jgi:carbamoyltransferase
MKPGSNHSILGISAFYHDSAAALVVGGKIVAAAQEERFTRNKHDAAFPVNAIGSCLREAGLKVADLNEVVFYEKPLVKFERLLETYLACAPYGLRSFLSAMPVWLKEKLFLKNLLKKELCDLGNTKPRDLPPLLFAEHHQSHAASAFFASPFTRAAVLCLDGVGEWSTTTVWTGTDNVLTPLWEIDFPHSLGLLYSAFTYYLGFRVNSGEYKVMGLAPYGQPKFVDLILDKLVDVKDDGTFRLNMSFFNYLTGLTMTNERFHGLFGEPPREPESEMRPFHMDVARSIQDVIEEIVLRLGRTVFQETGERYLCLGGGVALNCVANGRLLREGPFEDIWIQPAAGDAGGALGAALASWYQYHGNSRVINTDNDTMQGALLGPSFSNEEIQVHLDSIGAVYEELDENELLDRVVSLLHEGKVVGWFQGRMEFGPRALGCRSILGDPRNRTMQSIMNLKIKFRESFRPFAPSVLSDRVSGYFDLDRPSPYMLLVAPVSERKRISMTPDQEKLFGIEKLKVPRSEIPAITHVDYSARVQTVHEDTNRRYYDLLRKFEKKTSCPVVVNTSFNVRGEPIVGTPEDAYRCFMRTEMDCLVLENFLLMKADQPQWYEGEEWRQSLELD